MKITQPSKPVDPDLYAKIRAAVVTTQGLLVQADLATPEVREFLNGCRVELSRRLISSAGSASHRKRRIVLNLRLLSEHPHLIPETVAHEVAHLVADFQHRNHNAGHDRSWKEVMIRMGFEPKRCYRLDAKTTDSSAEGTSGGQ